jgi:hypothetical protein
MPALGELLRRPPIRTFVMVAALALLATLVYVSYEPEGTPLLGWTLRVDGVSLDAQVIVPSRLPAHVRNSKAQYTLERELQLSPEQRGRPLTLTLACFHGHLALFVDGVAVVDAGDVAVGDHRYLIGEAITDRARLHLMLAPQAGIDTTHFVPRLVDGIVGRSWAAVGNRYTQAAAWVVSAFFTFVYGLLSLLDRRRREYLAAFLSCLSVLATQVFGLLDIETTTVAGRIALLVPAFFAMTTLIAFFYFVHLAFPLHRPRRVWLLAFGLEAAVMAATPFSAALLVPADLLYALLNTALMIYWLTQFFGLACGTAHRYEAWLLLVWSILALVDLVFLVHARASGTELFGGFHIWHLLVMQLALSLTAVLASQFVARQRTLQRTTQDLRREVVERSRALADALTTLAYQPTASTIGRTIDSRYLVLRQLGAGGMGTVYEVERVCDQQRFAMKTLKDRVDIRSMVRFAREAQLAAELGHPNLVPVLDAGVDDGTPYLVMELVDGGSLEDQRPRFGDAAWATPLLEQTALGLTALHARGIVHRDLKPSNILLARGVARIADFGLALSQEVGTLDETELGSRRLTRAGDMFGTPTYMAPEVVANARAATPSADVFSFGVIAYELLTGRARTSAAAEPSSIDARLRSLVELCVDRDPMKRPRMIEVVERLRTLL